jgi:hypothetical protein
VVLNLAVTEPWLMMKVLPEPDTLMFGWAGAAGIGSSPFGVNFNLLNTVYHPKALSALRPLKLELDNRIFALAAVDAARNELFYICGRLVAKGRSFFFRVD